MRAEPHPCQSRVNSGQALETSCNNEDMTVATHGDTAIANYRFVVKFTGPNVDVDRRYRTMNLLALKSTSTR